MKKLERAVAFRIKPLQVPCERADEREDGGLDIVVRIRKPRWHRLFGDRREYEEKRFELDSFGREVYEACDGRHSVESIVRSFAAQHHISRAEAEVSVTAFLRTLIGKRLIVFPRPSA